MREATNGRTLAAAVANVPNRSRTRPSSPNSRASRIARALRVRTSCARSARSTPTGVSLLPRGERVSTGQPTRRSRFFRW